VREKRREGKRRGEKQAQSSTGGDADELVMVGMMLRVDVNVMKKRDVML
jgi:hypothetical protein